MLNRLNELWRSATRPRTLRDRVSDADPVRLVYDEEVPLVYAVGDVHGRLDLLLRLEEAIVQDRSDRLRPALLVYLGDLIDRGPASAQVLDHVMSRAPQGFERVCLMGNHEAMFLDFLAAPRPESSWLSQGGHETLLSYGVPPEMLVRPTRRSLAHIVQAYVPGEHLAFLKSMPVLLQTPTKLYVHAGIDSTMRVEDQPADVLLWYRDDFAETYESLGRCVVHGHSFTESPLLAEHRVAIDTGAYRTGRLTAVAIEGGGAPRVIDVTEFEQGAL